MGLISRYSFCSLLKYKSYFERHSYFFTSSSPSFLSPIVTDLHPNSLGQPVLTDGGERLVSLPALCILRADSVLGGDQAGHTQARQAVLHTGQGQGGVRRLDRELRIIDS